MLSTDSGPSEGGPVGEQPIAVVLGENIGACRALSSVGVRVAAIDNEPRRIPKKVEFHPCPPYAPDRRDAGWSRHVCELGRRLSGAGRPVLFPVNDSALLAVSDHHQEITEVFRATWSRPDLVTMLVSKTRFADWAGAGGVPIPWSRVIRNPNELPAAADSAPIPCIVKPNYTFKLEQLVDRKLFLAHSRTEILSLSERLLGVGLEVVLQQDLSRPDPIQWSLTGVCAPAGQLRQAVLSRKLRQVAWGAGTAMETLPMDERVLAIARRIAEQLGLNGLFEVELRPDRDGAPRVLEVNARVWSQVRLPAVAGLNLLHSAYLISLGRPIEETYRYRAGIGWISWRRDLSVCLGIVRRKPTALWSILRSLFRLRVIE